MHADRFSTGFILGMIAPVLGFFGYAGIYVTTIRPQYDLHWFVNDLFLGTREFRAPVLSLSLIADAVLFFLLDRYDLYKAMRGVIGAMLVYGVVIVIFAF